MIIEQVVSGVWLSILLNWGWKGIRAGFLEEIILNKFVSFHYVEKPEVIHQMPGVDELLSELSRM